MNDSVLMMSLVDPWKARDGGTLRNRATETYLRRAGWDVETLFPQAKDHEGPGFSTVPSRLRNFKRKMLPMPTSLGARNATMRRVVQSSDATLMHVSALSQAPYRRYSQARLWLDFMDLWSQFALREADARSGIYSASARLQSMWLRRAERLACKDAWLTTAAGWTDTQTLLGRGVEAVWLPTTLPDDEFYPVPKDGSNGLTAGFLGNFNYWPNRDAYFHLLKHWVPGLTAAGWNVVVAGLGSDLLPEPPEGVHLLGPIGCLDKFYSKIDAALAPIALGEGSR